MKIRYKIVLQISHYLVASGVNLWHFVSVRRFGNIVACIASVSIESGSKKRPRNGIFGARTRIWARATKRNRVYRYLSLVSQSRIYVSLDFDVVTSPWYIVLLSLQFPSTRQEFFFRQLKSLFHFLEVFYYCSYSCSSYWECCGWRFCGVGLI